MLRLTSFTLIVLLCISMVKHSNAQNIIQNSRSNCVRIESPSAQTSGSGFFISKTHVATCFHVVASMVPQGNDIQWQIYQDLRVILSTGDTIQATCISIPTQKDSSPLFADFAILKLKTKSPIAITPSSFPKGGEPLIVGSDVLFSGYPLATPAMVTHKGMISGISSNGNIICIQAAINKGSSGGALLNSKEEIIGIISMREGGISKGLTDLKHYIVSTERHGSVQIMGVDPLQSTKEIINVLDTYISTGIGYAINSKFLQQYIAKHPLK